MPWIMRFIWYDSLSPTPATFPLVITVDDTLFASWQTEQASTVSRAPLWKALASVFEPEVVPSAP